MRLYEYEQSRKPDRGNSRHESFMTDNDLWYMAIDLELEGGTLLRKGVVGRRQKNGSRKTVASWDYGERDEDNEINFQGDKLPKYVQDICIDLGSILGRRFPHTGIDHADPDYDAESGYSKYIRGI